MPTINPMFLVRVRKGDAACGAFLEAMRLEDKSYLMRLGPQDTLRDSP